MNRATRQMIALLVGPVLLGSCTTTYEQMLHERDQKISNLNARVSELTATNQGLQDRARGANDRVSSLEATLATRPETSSGAISRLQDELPGVDVRVTGNRLSLGINSTVTFSSGSSQLKTSAGTVLQNVARVLKREFPGRRIIIEGHTDTDPISKTKDRYRSNRHLSLERADAVATYLVKSCGVPNSSVVVAGYGEYQPIQAGRGQSAKNRNRRVEIVIGDNF